MLNRASILVVLTLWSCDGGSSKDTASVSPTDDDGESATDSWDSETDADADADADADTDTDSDSDADTEWEEPDEEETVEDPKKEECDQETPVLLYLSPDDSNSMASPVLARERSLAYGVPSGGLRTWEFFNYYSFDYPAPTAEDIGLTVELAPDLESPDDTWRLQIGVRSPEVSHEDRRYMNLTFSLDTSGSMGGAPMENLKHAMRAVAGQLKHGDTVSVVKWASEQTTLLDSHVIVSADDEDFLALIDSLGTGGSTNFSAGLNAAYRLAEDNYREDSINHVFLVSDGGANAGQTDKDVISEATDLGNDRGIYMVGVGVGDGHSYNDHLMDTVTDAGKGASVFISGEEEAGYVFGERFGATLDVWVRDVRVELDMPAGFEVVKFSGEEISTDPAEVEPQHLAPDDAMVFYQTIRHCAPEALTEDAQITVTVTYVDEASLAPRELSQSYSFGELLNQEPVLIDKGTAIYEYAEGLKRFRATTSEDERADIVAEMRAALGPAKDRLPTDTDLAEIETVLDALD